MSVSTLVKPQVDRRERILDAFEQCIARAGFHRTTMNDVAAEAEMSPGNLYRYFPSKDAIVEGLCARDREEIASTFSEMEQADDLVAAIHRVARRHFVEEPRERMVMFVEIWAEATRNPAVAAIHLAMEHEIERRLTALFERAKARGEMHRDVDPAALARFVANLADAFFLRRALRVDFEAEPRFAEFMAILSSAMRGAIDFASAPPEEAAP